MEPYSPVNPGALAGTAYSNRFPMPCQFGRFIAPPMSFTLLLESSVPLELLVVLIHVIKKLCGNYSIIYAKKFVNTPKSKQFMNEWAMLCYMTLYAVISHYSVLSHAKKIFTMHALCPLSMVEMNGKPPLTGAEGRAFQLSSSVSHKVLTLCSNYKFQNQYLLLCLFVIFYLRGE